MDVRNSHQPTDSEPRSLAWRCASCGFYQLFDAPSPQPPFCSLCGTLGMVSAGLGEPIGSPRGRR
jgi:hypothetical protein